MGAEERVKVGFDLSRLFLGSEEHEVTCVCLGVDHCEVGRDVLIADHLSEEVTGPHRVRFDYLVSWV